MQAQLLGPVEPSNLRRYLEAVRVSQSVPRGVASLLELLDRKCERDEPLVVGFGDYKSSSHTNIKATTFQNYAVGLNHAIRTAAKADTSLNEQGLLPILCRLEQSQELAVAWVSASSEKAPSLPENPYSGSSSLRLQSMAQLLGSGWTYEKVFDRSLSLFRQQLPDYPLDQQAKAEIYITKYQEYPESGFFLMEQSDLVGVFDFVPLRSGGIFDRLEAGEVTLAEMAPNDIRRPPVGGCLNLYMAAMCLDERIRTLGNRRAKAIVQFLDAMLDAFETLANDDPPIFFSRMVANVTHGPCEEFASTFCQMKRGKPHKIYEKGVVHSRHVFPFPEHPRFARRESLTAIYRDHAQICGCGAKT